ncbi:hypothetical protein [Marinobacterium mangrovicola]|uniref:Uncharacterized protein n=1 Tax=Marinobacterium mangrovicola TaxID=1476959 RepID=A0A4R1GSQ5_9GAMM|nr:hypothetical protein [Marinobacterium mangrovicola]TCK09259.1 hypothetical protein CLV83_1364 [Marinobacterium mangrovicola]
MNTMTFRGHWHAVEGIALASALILFIGVSLTPSSEYAHSPSASALDNLSQTQTRRGTRTYINSGLTEETALMAGSSDELNRRRMRADATEMTVDGTAEVKGRPGRIY